MQARLKLNLYILLVFGGWATIISLRMAQVIPLWHIDGAFQTASGLIRLSQGAVIGTDLFPYLGIGPLYALWPIFKLLGGTLSAAIAASQLLNLVLLVASISLLLHIFVGTAVMRSLAIGSLIVMVSYYAGREIPVAGRLLRFTLFPGNSMRFTRASLPYLVG